ncbi:MAG: wax ester/triacylglycerol synthase family O-acyltransferase [Desulfobacteraceae bacterium]|nr:wax ester/triacylglycerol synthase family O-acyltransferase [Desulfobacteraceae bacterium]MBC2755870.1 wax ester/triacylglycerol synthase family O-acyltransferase [Desulfobacteraceae bacterium]MBC2763963.1 wax ester/triacylglycerol synthase family O-acyltransferase [ANME-2 cluster archaeon]
MQELSGLDATFLYLETPNIPMHVGGVSVIEGSLDFDTFRDLIKTRIHLSRSFTQRLVQTPIGLDRPYWIDDPNFNLDYHLHHTALPDPGDWRQLRRLASRIFSQPLDRSRPLWEFVFVEGLNSIPQVPSGSAALISKVHHAAIDGVSGSNIMSMIFDITPKGRDLPPPKKYKPEKVPGNLKLFMRSVQNLATRPLKLPELLFETAKSTVKAGYLTRVQGLQAPTLPFNAPRTRLNTKVSPNRIWNASLLDFKRVQALRRAIPGSTVNDVILTICAGALRRYLVAKNDLPDEPLVAMVPVSIRTKKQKNTMGNQVSAMFIQLATDVEDHIERLQKICENTKTGKTYHEALDAKSLTSYAEFIPFALGGLAARVYSRADISKRHKPFFNVVITNVPGPQIPLYMAGHRLLTHMAMAPIFDGMGLILTIFSYNGMISISPTSAQNIMPDIDKLALFLREVANEMEADVFAKLNNQNIIPLNRPEPDTTTLCKAITKSGKQCLNQSLKDSQFCRVHSPQE